MRSSRRSRFAGPRLNAGVRAHKNRGYGMAAHDWDRPYIALDQMPLFTAIDRKAAQMYGPKVKAAAISNIDYKMRFGKLSSNDETAAQHRANLHGLRCSTTPWYARAVRNVDARSCI